MLPDNTQKTGHMKLLVIILCLLALTAEVEGQTKRRKSAPAAPVLPAEADASRLPPGYVGHNAAVIFAALRERRAQFRKGQFETTPEYESRVERIVSSLPPASARLTFLLRDSKVAYDADSSSFKITVETDYLFPDTYVAGDWSSPYGRFTSVYLVWNSRTVGSAVGRNAFGVRKRYKVTAYTSLRPAVPTESISRLTRGLTLPATPSSARVMYPGIRLALTGRLIPPYGGEETEVDEATISEPEEAHYFKYYVYFEPDAAVVYDIRTGEVYGSLDLTTTGPTPGTLHSLCTTASALAISSSRLSAALICSLSALSMTSSGSICAGVCAGNPADSTRRAKLGDGPALMRQPSRRAGAPMSAMYFERVRTSVSRTDRWALTSRCRSDVL
jgi:hypothetical protein